MGQGGVWKKQLNLVYFIKNLQNSPAACGEGNWVLGTGDLEIKISLFV